MEDNIYGATGTVAIRENKKRGLQLLKKEYEKQNLVVTPEGVFTLLGEKVVDCDGKAEIVTTPMETLIVTKGEKYGLNITIWSGKKVLMKKSCTDYRYSDNYLALKHGTIWSLYTMAGEVIEEAAFDAEDIKIHRDFVVTLGFGGQGLYSLREKKFLKTNLLRILCSNRADLILCAEIGNPALNIYSYGRWHMIPMEDEFGFVEGLDHMFYIKRGKKFFVYDEDVRRFMHHLYPDGVDFISCNNGLLLMVNNNKSSFFKR